MQQHDLKRLFRVLWWLLVPALLALAAIDAGLKVPAAPLGIISFEWCSFHSWRSWARGASGASSWRC